ncbi:MAG TPA: FecR domain-containing protein [Polyangiaceae bacterium]|jgi:ferric-dicitrate binding protein FerR (iron transport regulator)|nr:FecR domain-containing protein [Polyangiaceae bacterium]
MNDRPKPSAEQVSRLFRTLADQHADERARLSADRSWRRVEAKLKTREPSADMPGLKLLATSARRWRLAIPVAAAALALTGLVVWYGGTAETLTYTVQGDATDRVDGAMLDGASASGRDGAGWLNTRATNARVAFSDGSSLDLGPESAIQLAILGPHNAQAHLGRGHLRADIQHTDTTKWQFIAGPYQVNVVGTRFDLDWDGSALDITMHEGRVVVDGPGSRHWALGAGAREHLIDDSNSASERDQQASNSGPASKPSALPEQSAFQSPRDNAGTERSVQPRSPETRQTPEARQNTEAQHSSEARSPELQWPALVAKGQFARVLKDAKELHIEPSSLNERALTALGQAAGYSGEPELARRCWRQIRSKHATRQGAARAAFYLARLAEQQGDARQALEWLGLYAQEAPTGSFAAEALGRKLVLIRQLDGAGGRAREVAKEYLRRFPEGAYAEIAQATIKPG